MLFFLVFNVFVPEISHFAIVVPAHSPQDAIIRTSTFESLLRWCYRALSLRLAQRTVRPWRLPRLTPHPAWATAEDFYKWTMMPVIRALEQGTGGGSEWDGCSGSVGESLTVLPTAPFDPFSVSKKEALSDRDQRASERAQRGCAPQSVRMRPPAVVGGSCQHRASIVSCHARVVPRGR